MNGNGSVGVFVHLESFLVGLCCLVGGDQFYILVSQTDASVKTQCNMVVSIAIITLLVVIVLDDYVDKSLSNLFHLYYFFLLLATIIFSFYKTKSATIITVYNAFLAHVLTFFIVQVCINYSHYRNLMQTFLLGMLSSRLLPSFAWLTINKASLEPQTVLGTLSTRLNIIRVLICMLSLVLKLLNGTFFISFKGPSFLAHYKKYFESTLNFQLLYEVFEKLWMGSFPIFSLILSLVMFVTFSPIMHNPMRSKMYFNYSPHLVSSLSNGEIVFNLLGCCFGIFYPPSITANSEMFYLVNMLVYISYYIIYTYVRYLGRSFTNQFVYPIVITCSFLLGYLWSYCLTILYNTFLIKTCMNEDEHDRSCCGDKINSECYCRLPLIVKFLNDPSLPNNRPIRTSISFFLFFRKMKNSFYYFLFFSDPPLTFCRFINRFSCSQSFVISSRLSESLLYSTYGPNAILLLYKMDKSSGDITKLTCSKECSSICKKGICFCLNLIRIYELKTITTSNCDNCQLIVRLEAKESSCPNGICSNGGSGTCTCNGGGSNCCICVKCCTNCETKCDQCIRLCCCEGCKKRKMGFNGTRIFILFKSENCSYIRELTTNRTPSFDGKIHKQNLFIIQDIYMTDCCHVDIQVDLHCTMQNNFFRLTPIDYKNKSANPVKLRFVRKHSMCCTSNSNNCCCEDLIVDRLCLKFKPDLTKEQEEEARKAYEKLQKERTEKGYPAVFAHDTQVKEMEDCIYSCDCPKRNGSTCTCPCCKVCTVEKKECCCCMAFRVKIDSTTSYYKYIEPIRVKLICIIWLLFLVGLLVSMSLVSKTKDNRLRYYKFEFITSFKTIDKELKKNKLNYTPLVFHRLREVGDLTNDAVVKEKVEDLNTMLGLCNCAFDKDSLDTLKKNIFMKSNKLVSSPQFLNKKIGLELLKWSYCCGIVFTYVIQTFLRIQSFFVRWEYVWEREYFNYRKLLTSNFTSTIHISKFAVSLMSEVDIPEKNQYYIDRTRKNSWNDAHDELDRFVNLFDKEQQNEYEPPPNIDQRLGYYLNRWKHRVESIKYWTLAKTNVFEWKYFVSDYKSLKIWHDAFVPYLQRAAIHVDIPKKKLNEEIDIFTGRKKK